MRHTRLWIVASILASLIIVDFIFSVPHTKDIPAANTAATTSASITESVVAVRDVYKKGVHTISGFLDVPTPCTGVQAAASLSDATGTPQRILLALTVSEAVGICLQQTTGVSFSATLTAPAGLPLDAIIDGKSASTTRL